MKLKTKILIGILFYFAFTFIVGGFSAGAKYLPMSLVGIVIGFFTYKYMRRKQAEAEEQEAIEEQEYEQMPQQKTAPQHHIQLVAPEGGDEDDEEDDYEDLSFSIKGINYANLDDSYLGDHDGYIKAVTDNPKDPYAIAVYVGRKRVGWLPAGNRQLHEGLLSIGGKAVVHILISKGYDDFDNHPFYYGTAVIPK